MKTPLIYIAALSLTLTAKAQTAQTEQQAGKLLQEMTEKEKFAQLYGLHDGTQYTLNSTLRQGLTGKGSMVTSGRNSKRGIPGITFVDGPKGVSYHGKHVIYPAPVLRGCSFDRDLEYRVGQALATETKAVGANYIGAVTLNITTHPQCGQAELWYGEDPFHVALMGVSLTRGIQHDHKVMACAKHFAMFELETNKGEINAVVGQRALNEVYLLPFMKAVKDANVASMMTSYNKVNGTFTSENKRLLTDIARNKWGFRGYYTSDWGFSVYNCLNALRAGSNVEMPCDIHFRADSIRAFINAGQYSWAELDNTLRPILSTKLQYGENEAHRLSRDEKKELINLSQEVAEKSMVLLKNNGVLPFNPKGMKQVLVVGQLAKSGNLGEWHYVPDHNFSNIITPLRGLRKLLHPYGVSVVYASGEDLNEVKFLAQKSDAVIVCIGRTDFTQSQVSVDPDTMYPLATYNGGDRQNLDITTTELGLMRTCYRNCQNMAVTYFGGSAVITSTWERLAPSIVYAGFGGQNGGLALAKILFGDTNPSGKLSFSIFKHESDYPSMPDDPAFSLSTKYDNFDPHVDAFDVDYDYYFGYRLAEKKGIEVSYPFGYGLSYTTFSVANPATNKKTYSADDVIRVSCTVKNTGNREGAEVVQAYVGTDSSAIDQPQKALKNFAKVNLKAGESKNVELEIPVSDLAYWNESTDNWSIEKTSYTLYVGTSSQDKDLQPLHFNVK